MTDNQPSAASPSPKDPPAEEPRALPSLDEIARWAKGEDLPTLGALFSELPLARFDALMMQIRKEELLAQHWQVIGERPTPDPEIFESYPEIVRLRATSAEAATAESRIEALRVGWHELAAKQPALWTASDLFVVLRRIIERELPVDFNQLLTAVRDVWRDLPLPHGREQLETLWACLDLTRQKTKQ